MRNPALTGNNAKPLWHVIRKPDFPRNYASNIGFSRVIVKSASKCNNASNLYFAFGCVMRKPAFPRNNATNWHFLVRHEKRNSASNINFVFGRVMRKPAFPRNNETNLNLFGASRGNLLFHVITH